MNGCKYDIYEYLVVFFQLSQYKNNSDSREIAKQDDEQ